MVLGNGGHGHIPKPLLHCSKTAQRGAHTSRNTQCSGEVRRTK